MKAAVCYEFKKPLVVEEVKLDPPQKGEVKIKMVATAVCHSDIHVIRGELFPPSGPMIAGHESAGYVDEIGEGVYNLKKGDPVIVSLVSSCGYCYYCIHGMPHLCGNKFPLATESRLHTMSGQNIIHIFKTATFAEYAIVDQSQVVKIPDDMPMDAASLLGCGVITGFGSVVKRAVVKAMESVTVIGAGGVGLNAIQGAALSGAYPVIAVDVAESKLKAARDFGATHTVNAKEGDPVEGVKKLTGGRGAQYVFVTVGSISAMQQGFNMSDKRGWTVFVGLPKPQDLFSISPFALLDTERVVTGGYMGSTNLQRDIPEMIDLYKAGKLKLDELVTKHYTLDQINEAIESVERGEALRNVIMFK
ncbi:MAG: Zn-dependent alcohol dehydrogenase [Dehalococcoidales bacterium]|nr:Zn-dependent alcohol dehydrogenase [Dehalococcoidales bacterium]